MIPVLVDGASMPTPDALPESVHALPFRHALEVRTQCFLHDIAPLRSVVCEACNIVPQTLCENFIARIHGVSHVDERIREKMAVLCSIFACIGILGTVLRRAPSIQSFVMFALAVGLGAVGKNSRRLRWFALCSILIGSVGILVLISMLVGWGAD